MKYTFQYFMDIATSADTMQVITINAGGSYLMARTRHLWPAYKYMKMGKISVKLLPASTLPVDPLGLGYGDSDPQTIDPRDQMNPGLVRITNGEDFFNDVASLSEDEQIQVYNTMMLDPRWSKFMLQSGFRRSALPLYWNIGELHQDAFPGATLNLPQASSNDYVDIGGVKSVRTNCPSDFTSSNGPVYGVYSDGSSARSFFQTGHRGRLGWMPTDALYAFGDRTNGGYNSVAMPNAMPTINCITVVLPKAYKTLYYYRLFVTETVYFSGIKNVGLAGSNDIEYGQLDSFVRAGVPVAAIPGTSVTASLVQGWGNSNSVTSHNYDELNDGDSSE